MPKTNLAELHHEVSVANPDKVTNRFLKGDWTPAKPIPEGMAVVDGALVNDGGTELYKQNPPGPRWKTSPAFENPQALLEEVISYFQWLDNNPIMESRVAADHGEPVIMEIPKPRAPSIKAMCMYIGISRNVWRSWRLPGEGHRPEIADLITWAEDYIIVYKFEHAAAGQLNSNLIARDLGLIDKQEIAGGTPVAVQVVNVTMTPEQASEAYAQSLHPEVE